jgi:hypothetical protein
VSIADAMVKRYRCDKCGILVPIGQLHNCIIHPVNPDPINHPPHYTFGKYEVLDVLQDWFPFEPILWQVVKYISRSNHKGHKIEDLKKAEFYLKKAIEIEENKEKEKS